MNLPQPVPEQGLEYADAAVFPRIPLVLSKPQNVFAHSRPVESAPVDYM
jgi:hypothetical protein